MSEKGKDQHDHKAVITQGVFLALWPFLIIFNGFERFRELFSCLMPACCIIGPSLHSFRALRPNCVQLGHLCSNFWLILLYKICQNIVFTWLGRPPNVYTASVKFKFKHSPPSVLWSQKFLLLDFWHLQSCFQKLRKLLAWSSSKLDQHSSHVWTPKLGEW